MKRILTVFGAACLLISCSDKTMETSEKLPAEESGSQAAMRVDENEYKLTTGDITMTVNPVSGGRISQISVGDYKFLTGPEVNDINWGSTFWPSPQSQWGWPPPAVLDKETYLASVSGDTIFMGSGVDNKLHYIFTKNIYPTADKKGVTVEYRIRNTGAEDTKVAPWEITRVKPGGITFYPTGDTESRGLLAPLMTKNGDITWFDYNSVEIPGDVPKLLTDGKEGWLAQVNDGYILIKQFPDIAPEEIAPEEGEIELYTNPDKSYMEIEQQGAYKTLKAGETNSWKVNWYLIKLPESIKAEAGNPELVEFVREQVK